MSTIIDAEGSEELDAEQPTNEDGRYICSRPCKDGSPCVAHVPFGYMTCYQHDRSQPIVRANGERDD